ncbi:hypothetical protein MACK_000533 [Theileria orientalis]|uniref:Uncharacterized protein n=1 Tax=Theileria orientalis TaxID=68886 RepID=A0A976QWK5_THEOR|nr:hypothetical protein MACK_000533 [Theileria orientalis]
MAFHRVCAAPNSTWKNDGSQGSGAILDLENPSEFDIKISIKNGLMYKEICSKTTTDNAMEGSASNASTTEGMIMSVFSNSKLIWKADEGEYCKCVTVISKFSSKLEGSEATEYNLGGQGQSDQPNYSYISSNHGQNYGYNDHIRSMNDDGIGSEGRDTGAKYKLIFIEILPYSDYKIKYYYSLRGDEGMVVRAIDQTTYNFLLSKMADFPSFNQAYIEEIENELANEPVYKISSDSGYNNSNNYMDYGNSNNYTGYENNSQNWFTTNNESYNESDESDDEPKKFANLKHVDEFERLKFRRKESRDEEEPSFELEYVGRLVDVPNSLATGSGNAPIAVKFEPYIPNNGPLDGLIKPKGVLDIIKPELTNNVRYEYEINDWIPTLFVKASTSKYSRPIKTIYENMNLVWHNDEARMMELKAFSSYGEYKLVELIYQSKSEGTLGVLNYDFDEVVDEDQRMADSEIEQIGPYGETYITYFKKVDDSWEEVKIREYENTFNQIKMKINHVDNVMLNLEKMDNAELFFQKYEKGDYFDAFTYFPITGYTLNMVMDGDAIIWRSKNKRCVAVIVVREPAFDRGVELSFQGYSENVVVGNGSSISGNNGNSSSGSDLGEIRFIKLELLGTGGSSSTKRIKTRCFKKLESDDIPIGKGKSDGSGNGSSSGGSFDEENTLRLSRRYVRITDAEFERSINGELELNFRVRLPSNTSEGSKGEGSLPLTKDSMLLDEMMDRANMVDGPGRVEDTSTKCDTATTTTCSRVAARNRIIHFLPRKGSGGELPPTAKLFKQEEDGISFDSSITFGQVHEEPEDRPVNLMEEEDRASVSSVEKVQKWLEGGVKAGQIGTEEGEWSSEGQRPIYGDAEYDQNKLEDYYSQRDHEGNVYEQSRLEEETGRRERKEGSQTKAGSGNKKRSVKSTRKSCKKQGEKAYYEKLLLDVAYYKKYELNKHNGVQYKTFTPPEGKMFTTLCNAGHVIWRAEDGESCDFVRVFFPYDSPQLGLLRVIGDSYGEGVDLYFVKEGDDWMFVTSESMMQAFKSYAIDTNNAFTH